MIYLLAFVSCGFICMLCQFIMDKFKLTPLHLILGAVVVGGLLEAFNIYDTLIDIFDCGVMAPISNFGHSLTHASVNRAKEDGIIGLITGVFDLSSSGIAFATLMGIVVALIFKPKG